MIVGLTLEARFCSEPEFEVAAEEGDSVPLVGIVAKSHPDEMNVIGHEDINGAKQRFACRGVEHQFAKLGVKRVAEPAGAPPVDGHGPENDRVALVSGWREAR